MANGDYRIRVRIFDADTAGTQLYEELFDNTTDYGSGACPEQSVQDGYFRIEIGVCNTITTDAYKSLYNNTELYTEISLDFDKDGTYEEVFAPRRRLGLAPGAVSALQLVSDGAGTSSNTLSIDDQGHLQFEGVGRFGLGIGGATPITTMEIYDSSDYAGAYLYGVGNGFSYSGITLGRDTRNGPYWSLNHRSFPGETGNFMIEEYDGVSYNQRLVIEPGGRIGIGIINPDDNAQINISGNDGVNPFRAIKISNQAGDSQSQIAFEESSQDENFVIRYNGSSNRLEFWGGAFGSLTNLVTFDRGNGNITSIGSGIFGNDVTVADDLILVDDLISNVGDLDVISNAGSLDLISNNSISLNTNGNNDINFNVGTGGDFNLNLTADGGANTNCFELRVDGVERVRFSCGGDSMSIQPDLTLGDDLNLTDELRIGGNIIGNNGNLGINVTGGSLDIDASGVMTFDAGDDITLTPGSTGDDLNLNLNSGGSGTNADCYNVNRDGVNRIRFDCQDDEYQILSRTVIGAYGGDSNAQLNIVGNDGTNAFTGIKITNAAGSGQSQLVFEESTQDMNFVIRYNGGDNQLEFLGGAFGTLNTIWEIDRGNGSMYITQAFDRDNVTYVSDPSGTSQFNTLNAVAGNTVSDRRLKTNVNKLSSALDMVNAMQGVRFNWRETSFTTDTGTKIGFIAQDLAKVVPEVVNFNDRTGYYGVEYGSLVAVMAEAIKELDSRTRLSSPTITVEDIIDQLDSQDVKFANLTLTGDGLVEGNLKVKGNLEVEGIVKQNVKTVSESYEITQGDTIVYADLDGVVNSRELLITFPESITEIGASVRVRFIGSNTLTEPKIMYSNNQTILPEIDITYEFIRTEKGWLEI